MKYLIYISLLLILVSCTTAEKCAKKFPPKIERNDSIITKMVLKEIHIIDTVKIRYDSIVKQKEIITKTGKISNTPVKAKTEFAEAIAWVINNKLYLKLIQNDSLIRRKITANVKVVEKEKYITKTITKTKTEYKTHWYHTAAVWIAIPVIIIVLAFAAIQILKIIKPL